MGAGEIEEEDRKLGILNDLTEIYSGPYKTAKSIYSENICILHENDVDTEENLSDIPEKTKDVFEAISQGDLDGAEEKVENLRSHSQQTVFEAARKLPEWELNRLKRHRYPFNKPYQMLFFSGVPPYSDHRGTCDQVEERLNSVDDMDESDWERAVEEYEEIRRQIADFRTDTPKKGNVKFRALIMLAGAMTILTSLGTMIPNVPIPGDIPQVLSASPSLLLVVGLVLILGAVSLLRA